MNRCKPASFLIVLIAHLLCALAPAAGAQTLDSYRDAYGLVQRSLEAHGGIAAFTAAGGVEIELEGSFDLAARLQGRTLRDEPTPITELIAIDLGGQRVGYDLRWHNYFHSVQDLREVYDAEGRVLFVDKRSGNGGWIPQAIVPDARARFHRYLPHLLLDEALAQRHSLRSLGRVRFDGSRADAVTFTTTNGEALTIYIDTSTKLVHGAGALIDMPLLGDTEIAWTWSGYTREEGLVLPTRFHARLGKRTLKTSQMTVRAARPEPARFAAPAGIETGAAPPAAAVGEFVPYGEREPAVETVAPGIHLVGNLRPGFHLLFVEFEDHVVAIDAPTGWYEIQQIPPMNWSLGDVSSSLGEKFLRAIKQTVPDKPVRYVVLTHHHSDHIGGIRPFLDAGATVLAGAPAAELVRRAARASFTLGADSLTGRRVDPDIDIVRGERTLSDASMTVQLIELPAGNPKADGYLMVYLPQQKLLYTTAFIYPLPEAVFPPAESVDLSIWFVEWLDASGLEVDTVLNVHGTGRVEAWHLERIRELARERM